MLSNCMYPSVLQHVLDIPSLSKCLYISEKEKETKYYSKSCLNSSV